MVYKLAVTQSPLGSLATTTGATSYTVSITPTANRLVVVSVYARRATSTTTPTASGNSLTYVEITNLSMVAGGTPGRITVFRAMGASPSSGNITIDFAGETQDGCCVSVSEYDGVDTSGTHGSGAVVQSGTGTAGSGTAMSVTLAAFGDATNNAAFGAFGQKSNATFTADTAEGYAEIHNVTFNTPNSRHGTEWKVGQDLAVEATAGSSAEWGGIAIEIKAAAVTTERYQTRVMHSVRGFH